jgi:hypothetical protein
VALVVRLMEDMDVDGTSMIWSEDRASHQSLLLRAWERLSGHVSFAARYDKTSSQHSVDNGSRQGIKRAPTMTAGVLGEI